MKCKICTNQFGEDIWGACAACLKRIIQFAIESADKCARCGYNKDHNFHTPASECEHCKSPKDHHKYERRNRFEEYL